MALAAEAHLAGQLRRLSSTLNIVKSRRFLVGTIRLTASRRGGRNFGTKMCLGDASEHLRYEISGYYYYYYYYYHNHYVGTRQVTP
jgi:hypothetical protein